MRALFPLVVLLAVVGAAMFTQSFSARLLAYLGILVGAIVLGRAIT